MRPFFILLHANRIGNTKSFSRRVFLIRARAMSKPSQKPRRNPNLRQSNPAVEGRIHHGRAQRQITNKRKQNADRRNVTNLRACARRAPCKARTPVGVPLRLSPRGLSSPKAQRQATLPGSSPEHAILWTANRGEDRTRLHGHYPRRKTPVPVQRAPRAPVIVPAGLMPKPPECASDEPSPAGTATRPADRCHPAGVLHEEREAGASIRRAVRVKNNSRTDGLYLIPRAFLLRRSRGARRRARAFVRIKTPRPPGRGDAVHAAGI